MKIIQMTLFIQLDNEILEAKLKQSIPVVKVDGLEGVDTLGTPIRHPGQATKRMFSGG